MIPPALLAAVLECPGDDAPRLASADWLDEHAGAVPCPQGGYDDGEPHHLCARCRGTGTVPDGLADRAAYIRACVEATRDGRENGWTLQPHVHGAGRLWNPVVSGLRPDQYTYRRGFVAALKMPLADWTTHAPALLAAHPLERAEASDVPGLVFEVWPPGVGRNSWRLYGTLTVPRVTEADVTRLTAGVVTVPVLIDDRTPSEWSDVFAHPTRAGLVAGASAAVAEIAARLEAAAGDRWPGREPMRWTGDWAALAANAPPLTEEQQRAYRELLNRRGTIRLGEVVEDPPAPR